MISSTLFCFPAISSLFSPSPLTFFFFFFIYLFRPLPLSLSLIPSLSFYLFTSFHLCLSLSHALSVCLSFSFSVYLSLRLSLIYFSLSPSSYLNLPSLSLSIFSLSVCVFLLDVSVSGFLFIICRSPSLFLPPSHSMYLCACLHFSLHFLPFSFFLVTCSTCPP